MRSWRAVVTLVVCLAPGGCFRGGKDNAVVRPETPAGFFAGPTGANVVQLEVALLERPIGDDFINRGLWDMADEQGVSLERRAALEDNGLRVCQIGGMAPSGLQAILTSPRSNPNPRCSLVHSGKPVTVALGPVCPRCWFRLRNEGVETDVDLTNAQCLLEVVPTLTDDGKVRLQLTPRVRHGETGVRFAPQQDPSGTMRWERAEDQPEEAYEHQAWELTVAPNEMVVIGTWRNRPGTLGHACFLQHGNGPPAQRLLVLRTNRSLADPPRPGADLSRSPPLACRAGQETVRGTGD